jgi:hypothetical protein
MPRRIAALLVLAVAFLPACAGRAWRDARGTDTIQAYHAFLREYPDATFAQEARARLALVRVRKRPSTEAFEKFREEYGTPELLAELRPQVEEAYFLHARATGTPASYQRFLDEFPGGAFAERARGNAEYLENGGFEGDVAALSAFVEARPESDFAAEAERSVATLSARGETGFERVGLVIDVSARTPGRDRLVRVFRERVEATYGSVGLRVVPVPSGGSTAAAGVDAVLEIRHDEGATESRMERGAVTESGILATTTVTLRRLADPDPIWSDVFGYRAPRSAARGDVSILFGPGSHSSYWAELDGEFFVPVARWSTQRTVREPWAFKKPPVAVEVSGNRAIVLFGDGDFDLLDLGDPAQPVLLGTYRRPRDLSRFDGVATDGSRVVVFGPDGAEIVVLDGEQARREVVFGREVIGSVADVVSLGGTWIAATNRGLVQLGASPEVVRMLVPRRIAGMARAAGDRVIFADGVSIYTATLPQLLAGRIEAELRLGRGFNPTRVCIHGEGDSAVVLGTRDAVWVDLRSSRPQLRSRIGGSESGRIRDAAVISGRLFLLGPRGLQVADASGERIVDSVDVEARERIDVSGRHLVMIGERSLQVVDATPFVVAPPASR